MVTFYQRLDYKSRKKPLVSQIIIYFFHLLQQRQKLIHLTPIKKKKVLQTLLPSQRTRQLLCNTFIIHSEKDHSISGRSPPPPSSGVVSGAPFNSIQKMLSLTSVRFIDLLPLFFMASDYHPTGLLQYIK